MRKFIMRCLGVVTAIVVAQFALAEVNAGVFNDCSPCEEISECNPCDEAVFCDPCAAICGTKKSKWFVNGFLESGVWANEYGNKNRYNPNDPTRHNVDSRPGNNAALQNVKRTGYQVNQLYISAGKSVDGRHGWDIGGQVDFVFGTDANMVQSAGLETSNGHDNTGWGTGDYYSAFAQAYVQAAYKDLNIYAGKFFAPFGAQGFRGDGNFFYSFAPNWNFVPATASGAYATYAVNSKLTVVGGWVVPDQFGETSHNNAFLGGAIYQATKKLNLAYFAAAGTIGEEYPVLPANGINPSQDVDYFVNSLVATYDINKKWKAVVDWSLFNTQIDAINYNYTAWGINAALYYQYSKTWAFGARYNYVSGSDYAYGSGNSRYGINGLYGNFGDRVQDWSAISLGANWTPVKWLVVKPEVRWDFAENAGGGYFADKGGVAHKQQFSGGLSTIVKF